ncbi:DUF4349 domain-containing protein [Chitinophaga sp. S165]|uniref:DUF4349 domain-containing protein n=1 Tax=Chitinophaga sp. S165 TaxID=2135462 RepID=UPI000D71034E|nr:DUF4349 domain-containing protein [Chitinophaga sp. S165]PWV51775.1 uncharacterized protein DUF4349 [Chitinophaga sp. S165]
MTRRCSFLKYARIVISYFVFSIVLLISACGHPDNFQGGIKGSDEVAMQVREPLAYAEKPAVADEPEAGNSPSKPEDASSGLLSDSYANIPKKIIKKGIVRYSVRDYQSARKELIAVVARNGGEIVNELESRSEISLQTQMEIRVPSAKFDSCLNALAGTGENPIEKKITSKDVTEEYVDMSARMKAKKEVEQRYLDILKQAKSVEDILKVEEQLKAIREEVEAAHQGRSQYIDHNVSMSTIHLSFYQVISNTTPQGLGFFSRLFFFIKDGWNGLLVLLVSLSELWPLWLAAIRL